MREFFSSGHVADLILAIMAAEFILLSARANPVDRAAVMFGVALSLAPGVCLLLALRAALTSAGWVWVAVWLTLALPAHIGDQIQRRR